MGNKITAKIDIAAVVVETCVSLLESLGEKVLEPILKLIPVIGIALSFPAGAIIKVVSKVLLTKERMNAMKAKVEGEIQIARLF